MKTVTVTAESPEQLDQAIENQVKALFERVKKHHVQIGIININFSTYYENDKPVFCSQIVYMEQSKFAINSNMAQA